MRGKQTIGKDKDKEKKEWTRKETKKKRGEEAEVETDVHTWSVFREALTGEHAHGPLESCTLASLFISLMCACVSLSGITNLCVCACLHDVWGLCLHCPISHASLLSLSAFESVYA